MAADIHLGAVYYEPDDGLDATPNTLDISFTGGPAGAQLTNLIINLDKNGNGTLDPGEDFFDTAPGGPGVFGNSPLGFTTAGFSIVSWTTIGGLPGGDGATKLVLTLSNFTAGKHLFINLDVDELGVGGTTSALVEGAEFEGSMMSAAFTAPHYNPASGGAVFFDTYPNAAADQAGVPRDNYMPPSAVPMPVRTAGAFIDLTPIPLNAIRGHVHAEVDGNMIADPGETRLGGVTIQLLDSLGNVINTTTTDGHGDYEFLDLPDGTYSVREIQPAAYFQEGAVVGTISSITVGSALQPDRLDNITLAAGSQGIEYNFVETYGSLSGKVQVDVDGLCDDPNHFEPGIGGVKMELLDSGGNVIATTYTAADGTYSFDHLYVGTYSIRETQPPSYFDEDSHVGTINGVSSGNATSGTLIDTIQLVSYPNGIHYNFCEELGSIRGRVIVDFNANDIVDLAGEKPIAGVTIELLDAAGNVISTTTTDADGRYVFDQLTRGIYSVHEVQPAGYLDGADYVGRVDGVITGIQPTNDVLSQINLNNGRHGTQYDFTETLAPYIIIIPPPPPSSPPVLPPPSTYTPPPVQQIFAPDPRAPDYYGNSIVGYTWHLSVVNAGQPRTGRPTQGQGSLVAQSVELDDLTIEKPDWDPTALEHGTFILRTGDEDQPTDRQIVFGVEKATPVVGDFNGDGNADVGVFREGSWYIDVNGNGRWDAEDLWAKLGRRDDLPVTGDWDGDGKADIAIFGRAWPGDPRHIAAEPGLPAAENIQHGPTKNVPPQRDHATLGMRAMQLTSTGKVRGDLIDHVFLYGWGGDVPISGDWTGEGQQMIGIFRDGNWKLDVDGDGKFTDIDIALSMGQPGDKPVIGDFNGDTVVDLGIYRDGLWHIDTNNDRVLDARDRAFTFGNAGDKPVVGDWDGDGIDDPGVYRDGKPTK